MGDTGEWWSPIIEAIGKGGINTDGLIKAKEQVVSQLWLASHSDEWEEISRNAKNASIYDKLIALNKHVHAAGAAKIAKSMEESLDEEFNPDPDDDATHDTLLRNIAKFAPPPSGGGRKSRRTKKRTRRRKSKKRTKKRTKKRKSRKHK